MKAALLLLAICACERAEPSPPPAPPPPDPVKQAREEFELRPFVDAIGTARLYGRGDFTPDMPVEQQFDEGDFIGRLRTLFGPCDEDHCVLLDRKTGHVITAYSSKSGPAYGGARIRDEHVIAARRAAVPLPAAPPANDFRAIQIYSKHLADTEADPEVTAAIARLDALVEAVPPADWEKTELYDDGPGVFRIGASHGKSFNIELPPDQAFEFIDHHGDEVSLVEYYLAHTGELARQRSRVIAAYRAYAARAKAAPATLRDAMLAQARDLGKQLGVR
jgi:hypothetical protein